MTTEQAEQTQLRPFHETIVEEILCAHSSGLECLAPLIKATKIPKGHDEIIAAWKRRRKKVCRIVQGEKDEVLASLLAQKQAAEAKASEKGDINLDELRREIEKLRLLVKSCKLGSGAAYGELLNGFQNLNQQLVKQVLGK